MGLTQEGDTDNEVAARQSLTLLGAGVDSVPPPPDDFSQLTPEPFTQSP